jgi:predicted lactoylglutathione lyase
MGARFTVITLGSRDMRRAIAFYEALGFRRKMRATGEEVAFFDTGASVIALYGWDKLAADAMLPAGPAPTGFRGVTLAWNCTSREEVDQAMAPAGPAPTGFRGVTLAWNCTSREEVDQAMAHAKVCGATVLKPAQATDYGGYAGYFADPDGHCWEAVTARGIEVTSDGHVKLPD